MGRSILNESVLVSPIRMGNSTSSSSALGKNGAKGDYAPVNTLDASPAKRGGGAESARSSDLDKGDVEL